MKVICLMIDQTRHSREVLMEWFDEVSKLIVSWGHRYIVEGLAVVILFGALHFVVYPIMQHRSAAAKSMEIPLAPVAPAPQPQPTSKITTGPITTNGPDSPVTIGAPTPTPISKDKRK
jgi:hypothetical protein